MAAHNYDELIQHTDHNVVVVTYGAVNGEPVNVAVECEDCGVALLDFDKWDST